MYRHGSVSCACTERLYSCPVLIMVPQGMHPLAASLRAVSAIRLVEVVPSRTSHKLILCHMHDLSRTEMQRPGPY